MTILRSSAVAALVAFPALAQTGNEVIFVGTSTSGSTDNSAMVESATGAILFVGPDSFTNNVSDAVWADTGRNLYCSRSLGNQVSRGQWSGSGTTWSTFFSAPGACYGLGHDTGRKLLWVLTGATSSTRELHCLDADLNSAGYGTVLAQTTTLGNASRERWGLSPSGNLAAVPHMFINTGLFELIDTDPSSPTFLQVLVSTQVPGASAAGFAFVSDCRVSIDDAYAYVLYTGIGVGALAVYELATQSWLDFGAAPGQQDMQVGVTVPNGMVLSLDRSFALVAGGGSTTGVARIDFDYATPANSTVTLFSGIVAPNCNGLSMSPDGSRACVTSTPASVSPPGTLIVFDVATGGVLQTVALGNLWNIYTTAWQDASPVATFEPYGVGCSGTLGVPSLAAAPGSRPQLGSTFTARASNLPFGIALLQIGLSNTSIGGSTPLPLDLGFLGMPTCSLLVDPQLSATMVGVGTAADWSWSLPASPGLFGISFYAQAFSLDPAANAFGFAASNGAIATLGY
jgi:hypothetical protein